MTRYPLPSETAVSGESAEQKLGSLDAPEPTAQLLTLGVISRHLGET